MASTSLLIHHKTKLMAALLIFILSTETPLIGYLWRVVSSTAKFGFSTTTIVAIEEHTEWLKRYFTGPPSDTKMINHFLTNQSEFERLAAINATYGYCFSLHQKNKGQECTLLENKLSVRSGASQIAFLNSALRPKTGPCGIPCQAFEYSYQNQELQSWFGTKNPKIETWEKVFIYTPPLSSAEEFSLDSKNHPSDILAAIEKKCILKNSLDSIPAELEYSPGTSAFPNCAVRRINNRWFIKLSPSVKIEN